MLDIQLHEGLRNADKRDWKQLGAITGEAFSEDPVNLWIFGERKALAPTFSTLAKYLYLPHGICHLAGDEGAAMWALNSKRKELGALPTLALVWILLQKGSNSAARRAIAAGEAMAREHPAGEHLYLFTIGTRAAARGKGVGKRLITPSLAAADRACLPCYLENSNPANTGFYMSHGFERMKLFEPGPGAPPLEAMWREPRSSYNYPRDSE
ncbi:GNAT family N-acetyltransferase [Hyphomonas sp. WL0036]|uniref:GNAT family N-acetyltransferase n=1 Tax=Hyphomonas sediminis TaxID=2866160 RepID=UPI001C80399F|nr:GNAT family N-acetyltransferase [Hyphomonas sediminis]MBY9067609.1 GNAT family N-acetyltransferase [Hyphomonas sediminis]